LAKINSLVIALAASIVKKYRPIFDKRKENNAIDYIDYNQ